MSKIYNDGTNTPRIEDNNDRKQLGPVVVCRDLTDDEKRWPAWNANKTDVVVDTVAKTAWEQAEKPSLISSIADDGGSIDKKTIELIGIGIVHPSNPDVKFSLSEPAQISLVALSLKKDVITYPFPLSKMGGGAYMLQNAAELDSIAMVALTRISAVKTAGNTHKTWLRDPARTYAEIKNFVDDRI